MNISTKWQYLCRFPRSTSTNLFLYNNRVYFARDIVNLYSNAFKEASKEAPKLCNIVLCALI